jgi:predicted nucleic-acid-binding protein
MTGIDTNVLVRFFTEDDPDQARRAEAFLQTLSTEAPGFISLVSLAELVWVLRRRYGWRKTQLTGCLTQMLDSPEFVLEGQTAVVRALHRFARPRADFADCLIERSGHAAGCAETVTLDTEASKFAGMRLL